MPAWIVVMIISYIVRAISEAGEDINWSNVKADVEKQIRDTLPDWIEGVFVAIANNVIDLVAEALSEGDHLATIAAAFARGDIAGGLAALRDLIIDLVTPDLGLRNDVVHAIFELEDAPLSIAA